MGVSDEIVVGIIRDRIQKPDCGKGVTQIIEFQVPAEVLTERICGRWIHKASGRSYHTKSYDGSSPPTTENMKDDETGEALMQRADDNEDALKKRLQQYHDQTIPILKHYEASDGCTLSFANANQGIDEVWAQILVALK